MENPTDAPGVIERGVEDVVGKTREALLGEFPAGDRTHRDGDQAAGLGGAEFSDEADGRKHFAHRDGMQPDATGLRPEIVTGFWRGTQAFGYPVAGLTPSAYTQIKKDGGQRDPLQQPV